MPSPEEKLNAPDLAEQVQRDLRHNEAGNLDPGQASSAQAGKAAADDPEILRLLELVTHEQADRGKALDAIWQAISLREDSAQICNSLGLVVQERGWTEQAIELYQRAIELQPAFPEACNNLGTALMRKFLVEQAIAAYRQALQSRPNYPDALCNLGFALGVQGRYEAAIECYRQALRLDPELAEAHWRIGVLYEKTGQRDKAVEAYQRALRCGGENEQIRYYLAALTQQDPPPAAPPGYVKELFDRYADTYDAHLSLVLSYRVPQLIREALASAKPGLGLETLDLGCGTGLSGTVLRGLAYRLVGVDLSPRMLEKARTRYIYDDLIVGDLVQVMRDLGRRFDLIVASDVFGYIGDLEPVFLAAARALRPAGLFAFSVEAEDQAPTYVLQPSRRYAHNVRYIRQLARKSGFAEISIRRHAIRTQQGRNVQGWIVVLQQPSIPEKLRPGV